VPLLPMSQVAERFRELDPQQSYYILCKVGHRSLRVAQFLRQQGFSRVKSVRGGIDAWSEEIDPTVAKY
jgi:rhodanese-related sulfurtransferase